MTLLVRDSERSESGPQRRRSPESGRPLHCCCICGTLGVWNLNWSFYGSLQEEDDGVALPKFCNDLCKRAAGPGCENVTMAMRELAREKEMREPKEVLREATEREKYNDAVSRQPKRRK